MFLSQETVDPALVKAVVNLLKPAAEWAAVTASMSEDEDALNEYFKSTTKVFQRLEEQYGEPFVQAVDEELAKIVESI